MLEPRFHAELLCGSHYPLNYSFPRQFPECLHIRKCLSICTSLVVPSVMLVSQSDQSPHFLSLNSCTIVAVHAANALLATKDPN